MRKKIKVSRKDFSDKRLRPLFKRKVVSNMRNFYLEHEKYLSFLKKLKKNEILLDYIKKGGVHDIVSDLKKQIKFPISNKLNRKGECLCCDEKRESLDKAHVITRAAYKHYRIKPRTYFKWYLNSVPNILLVCSNCHKDLDHGRLSDSDVNRIISRKNKQNTHTLVILKRDIKKMKKVDNFFKKLEKKIKKADRNKQRIMGTINVFLEHKTDISKKDVRKKVMR